MPTSIPVATLGAVILEAEDCIAAKTRASAEARERIPFKHRLCGLMIALLKQDHELVDKLVVLRELRPRPS